MENDAPFDEIRLFLVAAPPTHHSLPWKEGRIFNALNEQEMEAENAVGPCQHRPQ